MLDGQLNLGLDLDLDIKTQKETNSHGRQRLYKLKIAKKFKHIIFEIYILQYANFLLLWQFPLFYGVDILVLKIYKFIILNGLS